MRKGFILGVAWAVLVWFWAIPVLIAQQKTPQLKPEIQLELVKTQNQVYKLALQLRNLESQYNATQTQFQGVQAHLAADTKTALERSGLDADKYEINADTFEVTEKPKVKQ